MKDMNDKENKLTDNLNYNNENKEDNKIKWIELIRKDTESSILRALYYDESILWKITGILKLWEFNPDSLVDNIWKAREQYKIKNTNNN